MKYSQIVNSIASEDNNIRFSSEQQDPISLWVEAALATNLDVVSLVKSQNNHESPFKKSTPTRLSPGCTTKTGLCFTVRNKFPFSVDVERYKTVKFLLLFVSDNTVGIWTEVEGMKETAKFAVNVQSEMQMWFIGFVEESLEKKNAAVRPLDGSSIAAVLSHLKQVNEWLDRVVLDQENQMTTMPLTDRIERLKRKIYGFVIHHVGSTYDNSASSA